MRRVGTFLMVIGLALGLWSGAALAGGGDWGPVPEHGHVMLIGVEFDEAAGLVYFDRCVELAAGVPLRGSAHHDSVHTGAAGGSPFAMGALFNAGNWVVPLAPFGPPTWTGCESFESPLEF